MKKLILFVLILAPLTAHAQKGKELLSSEFYITMNSILDLDGGLQFKSEYSGNKYLCFSVLNFSSGYGETIPKSVSTFKQSLFSINPEFKIGLEKRKTLDHHLTLAYGPTLGGSLSYQATHVANPAIPLEDRTTSIFKVYPMVGYSVGLLYEINKNLLIAAYLSPGLILAYEKRADDAEAFAINMDLGSESLNFSIVYRLFRKVGG